MNDKIRGTQQLTKPRWLNEVSVMYFEGMMINSCKEYEGTKSLYLGPS